MTILRLPVRGHRPEADKAKIDEEAHEAALLAAEGQRAGHERGSVEETTVENVLIFLGHFQGSAGGGRDEERPLTVRYGG